MLRKRHVITIPTEDRREGLTAFQSPSAKTNERRAGCIVTHFSSQYMQDSSCQRV